ncbi:MAG: energy-coupling factor ABC transporter permease [Phycisphaeraceae bacterium]|nr:energy-coupling factor ABC transporter permease [Phycisphaeraceae bacterium]
MHLGNGVVTPACAVLGLGVAGVGACVGFLMARRDHRPDPWRFAVGTALVFAAQALNVTVIPGSTSGHMIGGFLLAYWFGSAWALAAMTLLLAVQGVCYADGGLSALGLNVLNMGVIPCLVVFPLWKRLAGQWRSTWKFASLAAGAWLSVELAALACVLELLSQPAARSQWGSIVPAMLGVHALIGLVEAGATVAAADLVARLNARVIALVVPIVAVAAALGASPWPDGLESSLASHGLTLTSTGMIAAIDAWQEHAALWGEYAVAPLLMGCLILAILALIARGAGRRLLGRAWDK